MRLLILFVLFQSLFSCANTEEQVVENQFTAESDTNYLGFNTIIFDYISFVDTIITNEEYLNLMIPKGYTIAKSTHWKCSDYLDPFKYQIVVEDSSGKNATTFYPSLTFITNTSSLPLNHDLIDLNKDSVYHTNKLPKNAIDAIADYVIPLYVNSSGDLRIKLKKPLYNIYYNGPASSNKETNFETACIHFEYNDDGQTYEHIIYATLIKNFTHIETYNSTCEWQIKNIVGVRSIKNFLNDYLPIFQTIISSARLSPSWAYYYNYLCNNDFRKLNRISIIDYTNRFKGTPSIAEAEELAEYHRHQNLIRRTFSAYCMYLNHLDYYTNRDGVSIALPAGYSSAWSSTYSQILITSYPGYQPASDSDIAWTQIKRNESVNENYTIQGCMAPEHDDPYVWNELFSH